MLHSDTFPYNSPNFHVHTSVFVYLLQVSMPILEEDMLSGNLTPSNDAQLTIIHTTYLVIQCSHEVRTFSSTAGKTVFTTLQNKYFPSPSVMVCVLNLCIILAKLLVLLCG